MNFTCLKMVATSADVFKEGELAQEGCVEGILNIHRIDLKKCLMTTIRTKVRAIQPVIVPKQE